MKMRKVKQVVAFVLAFAMVFSTVWLDSGIVTYAAQVSEAESRAGESEAVSWDLDYISNLGEGYMIDENQVFVQTTEFEGTSTYADEISVPMRSDFVRIDTAALNELLGNSVDTEILYDDLEFAYQWSKAVDSGDYEPMEDETYSELYVDEVKNDHLSTKYRCEVSVTSVNGTSVPEGTDITLVYEKVFEYTGVTKDDIVSGDVAFEDYFDLGRFTDESEIIEFTNMTGSKSPEYFSIEYMSSGANMDYTLKALYADDSTEDMLNEENNRYLESDDFLLSYSRSGKEVKEYQLHIDFKYGGQILKSMEKKYIVEYIGKNPDDYVLKDCFSGLDNFTEESETVKYMDKDSTMYPSYFYIYPKDEMEDAVMDYTVSCTYEDNTESEEPVWEGESCSYLNYSSFGLNFIRDEKDVKSYKLHIDFRYGTKKLGSMDKVYNLEYIGGVTKENIDKNPELLKDYFEGLDEFSDSRLKFYSVEDDSTQQARVSLRGKYSGHTSMSYVWKAYAVDGKSEAVVAEDSSDNLYNKSVGFYYDFETKGEDGTVVSTEKKQVAYYGLTVKFNINDVEVAEKTIRYDVDFVPITANISPVPFAARKGETVNLTVSAYKSLNDGKDIGTFTYEWYTVDKEGTAKRIENETSNQIYVKVNDYDTSYKCVYSATKLKEAYPGIVINELSCTVKPEESAGYRLKEIKGDEEPVALGDSASLSVKTAVDAGYSLSYQWEKITEVENAQGEKEVQFKALEADKVSDPYDPSASAYTSYTMGKTVEDDFVAVYDREAEKRYTHRLAVKVFKGTEEMQTYYYYFYLRKLEEEPYTIDTNLYEYDEDEEGLYNIREEVVERGDNKELYVKSEIKDSAYKIEKKWYKLQVIEYAAKKVVDPYAPDGEAKIEYVPVDAAVTVPEVAGREPIVDYDSWDSSLGAYARKTVTYFVPITTGENDSVYSLAGKTATGEFSDIRGTYIADVTVTKTENEEISEKDSFSYAIRLVYNSGLKAYAKTSNFEGALGEAVSLEVIASNKNEALYPITYQWAKSTNGMTDFELIPNASGKTFEIPKLTQNDYGVYEVTVTDVSSKNKVTFQVVENLVEPEFHTPLSSYYKKSIGDSVMMEVKADIPESIKVEYNWYCTDKFIRYNPYSEEYENGTDENWQILNEEKPSYTAQVSSEENFGTYKCVARYKVNGIYRTRIFYYYVEDAAADIDLERTTPAIQYKRIGDSASYGVRYKTNSAEIKSEQVKYQWYYLDEEGERKDIEGAVSALYTVNGIASWNLGKVYCEVTYSDRNFPKIIHFETRMYTDITVEDGDMVEAEVGADVTLKPVVINPSNKTLTYQWYFNKYYDENYDDSSYGIIYGAEKAEYTISKIGENQFGYYECEIYDGDYYIGSSRVFVSKYNPEEKNVIIEEYESEISVPAGSKATFEVKAKSDSGLPLTYQWYRNDKAIGGAVASSYTIDYVLSSMAGGYSCQVRDSEGNSAWAYFELSVSSNLNVDSGYKNEDDVIGYQTALGQTVTLTANAKIDGDYQIFYQWYKTDDLDDTLSSHNVIYGATAKELALSNITMDDLGYYICQVTDANGSVKHLYYQVYINTGLVVEPSIERPIEAADGSVTMYVKASANEAISYQWAKYDSEEGEYVDLPAAVSSSYKIAAITKETMGSYKCTVSTSGEKYSYYYTVDTLYRYSQSREFAEQKDTFTFTASMINKVTDAQYTYVWYEADAVTGAMKKVNCETASYTGQAPVIKMDGSIEGYVTVSYICETYRDGERMDTEEYELKVLPTVTYRTDVLPQTSHPFDKRIDMQAYRVNGASNIAITLDAQSEPVLVIDAGGHGHYMGGIHGNTLTLSGNSAIFIADDATGFGYGYKVNSIVDTASKPSDGSSGDNKPSTGDNTPSTGDNTLVSNTLPKQGEKCTVGALSFKVTKSAATGGTVSVAGVSKNKSKVTSVSIPKTVQIAGSTFQVTGIEAKAFSGCKKLLKVTIGANVKSIGKQAFKGCSALKTITIQTTKLTAKSVGSQAFKGIKAKATIKVPAKKLSAYKKLLKSKGVSSKAKFKK